MIRGGSAIDTGFSATPQTLHPAPLHLTLAWVIAHDWTAGEGLYGQRSPAYAFWVVLAGALEVRLPEESWSLAAGDILFTPAGCLRDVVAPGGTCWHSIGLRAVTPGGIDLLAGYLAPHRWRPADADFQEMCGWMEQILRGCLEDGKPSLISEGLARAFLGLWLRHGAPVLPAQPAWLERVIAAIHRNPGVSVAEAAGIAGYSPAHFRQQFQRRTGRSPQAYLQEQRLEAARDLLAHSALPVEAIARRLRFAYPAHFTRFFTRAHGQTPTQYRQQTPGQAL